MSKTNSGPGLFAILMHVLLTLMTGGWWLLPLFIHIVGPRISGKPSTVLSTAGHSFLSTITGGLWLIVLIILWLKK